MKTSVSSRRNAFTLLEIMLVVAIISLLLGAAFMSLGKQMTAARMVRAQSDVASYGTKLKAYEAFAGSYPTTEQGLQALVTQPQTDPKPATWYQQMERLSKDPWNNDYIYVQPGVKHPDSYDLYSKGPDGIAGNQDDIWGDRDK